MKEKTFNKKEVEMLEEDAYRRGGEDEWLDQQEKTNLKTLKDIEEDNSSIKETVEYMTYNLALTRVKKEAIKWVKYLESPENFRSKVKSNAMIDILIYLHNITKEDLK